MDIETLITTDNLAYLPNVIKQIFQEAPKINPLLTIVFIPPQHEICVRIVDLPGKSKGKYRGKLSSNKCGKEFMVKSWLRHYSKI
jgi:hypothetical protein